MKQIICSGSIHDGFNFVGPFDDLPEALKFAQEHLKHYWSVNNLIDPQEYRSITIVDAKP